jgi:hypothetical protein
VNADALRVGLNWILHITAGEQKPPAAAWWEGDVTRARQVRDDVDSGRLHWRDAHAGAKHGLAALERGDLDAANMWLHQAKAFCIKALLKRVDPGEMARLTRPAKKRGRPKKD